jgi:hypothetical protein
VYDYRHSSTPENEILANWESAEKIGSEKTPHLT